MNKCVNISIERSALYSYSILRQRFLQTADADCCAEIIDDKIADIVECFHIPDLQPSFDVLLKYPANDRFYIGTLIRKGIIIRKSILQSATLKRVLHISGAFQKQDIEARKQDIEARKQDIEAVFPYLDVLKATDMREKSIAHTENLFAAYGYGAVFGRGEVATLLGLTPSPASELLRKLLSAGVIRSVSGMGKGRYRFTPPQKR